MASIHDGSTLGGEWTQLGGSPRFGLLIPASILMMTIVVPHDACPPIFTTFTCR